MKKSILSLFASCALAFVLVGCGSGTTLDSTKLKAEFGSASGEVKVDADKAISAIDAQNMSEAIRALGSLMTRSNDMSQTQIEVVGEAFVAANVIVFEKGDALSASEAKSKSGELEAQAKGTE